MTDPLTDKLVKALEIAQTYVKMTYDYEGGEEALEAKLDLDIIDAALAAHREQKAQPHQKIVVCSGSSRFIEIMAVCCWLLERDENAIAMGLHLLPAWYPNVPAHHLAEHENCEGHMDTLHLRKIDLADELFVVNWENYIGNSTANEIAYAEKIGKPIRYFWKDQIGIAVMKMLAEQQAQPSGDVGELVKRLQAWHTPGETITGDVQLYLDAAAELTRLQAECEAIDKDRTNLFGEVEDLEAELTRLQAENETLKRPSGDVGELVKELQDIASEDEYENYMRRLAHRCIDEITRLQAECETLKRPSGDVGELVKRLEKGDRHAVAEAAVELTRLQAECRTLRNFGVVAQHKIDALQAECEKLRADLHGMQDGSLLRDLKAENERLRIEVEILLSVGDNPQSIAAAERRGIERAAAYAKDRPDNPGRYIAEGILALEPSS